MKIVLLINTCKVVSGGLSGGSRPYNGYCAEDVDQDPEDERALPPRGRHVWQSRRLLALRILFHVRWAVTASWRERMGAVCVLYQFLISVELRRSLVSLRGGLLLRSGVGPGTVNDGANFPFTSHDA